MAAHKGGTPYGQIQVELRERGFPMTLQMGEKTRAEVRDLVIGWVETRPPEENYTQQNHIYSVKAGNLLSFELRRDETPVIEGCRMGHIFHDALYAASHDALREALDQVLAHSDAFEVTWVTEGGSNATRVRFELVG